MEVREMSKKQRPSTRLVKQILFSRYGHVCMVCGKKFDKKLLQYHHIVKYADGGATDIDNGGLVCANCHNYLHHGNEYKLNKQIKVYKETH